MLNHLYVYSALLRTRNCTCECLLVVNGESLVYVVSFKKPVGVNDTVLYQARFGVADHHTLKSDIAAAMHV